MKIDLLSGQKIQDFIAGKELLSQSIFTRGLNYCWAGLSLDQPEIDEEHLQYLSNIVANNSLRCGKTLAMYVTDSLTKTVSPLLLRRGYWKSNSVNFPFPEDVITLLSEDIGKGVIRLSSVISINSVELLLFCLQHSLTANAFFLISRTEAAKTETIACIRESISSCDGYLERTHFFCNAIESFHSPEGIVVLSHGGYDYGGAYLSFISNESLNPLID